MNARTLARALTAFVIAVAMLTGHVVAPGAPARAVVGGDPIPIEQVPWQALVYVEADRRLCGGSIVDASWIVTAAHCVVGFNADQVEAHVGLADLRQRSASNAVEIVDVIVHPEWDPSRFRNDIALLRVSDPIDFGPTIQPIALPIGLDSATWPARDDAARISGWGSTSWGGSPSVDLLSAEVRILGGPSDATCGSYRDQFDVAVEICAGRPDASVDTCSGDSGGPLAVDYAGVRVLAGITSVGNQCALPGFPGIYTRITTFVPWLQQYLPSAAESPTAPQSVEVTPLAGERLRVDWRPPRMAAPAPVTGYRAVSEPFDSSCVAAPGDLACVIDNVPAGRLYTVTVSAIYANGNVSFAEPVQAVSVDGVTSIGVRVRPKRLAQWAGLRARKVDDIRLAVRPGSKDICERVGTSQEPRGVRTEATGLCAVRVTVVRPSGTKRRAIAYVEVR